MELPQRILVAIGKDEVKSIVESDQKRQAAENEKRTAENARDEAIRIAAELRADLEKMRMVVGAIVFFIILGAAVSIALWFCFDSPPPGPPEPPPTIPEPRPRPVVPPRGCMRGCDPPDDWKYHSWRFRDPSGRQDFECWRDRGVQGPCF